MNGIRSLVDQKEKELLDIVEQHRAGEEKALSPEKEKLENLLASMTHCLDYSDTLLQRGTPVEIASTSQAVLGRLDSLLSLPPATVAQFAREWPIKITETYQNEQLSHIKETISLIGNSGTLSLDREQENESSKETPPAPNLLSPSTQDEIPPSNFSQPPDGTPSISSNHDQDLPSNQEETSPSKPEAEKLIHVPSNARTVDQGSEPLPNQAALVQNADTAPAGPSLENGSPSVVQNSPAGAESGREMIGPTKSQQIPSSFDGSAPMAIDSELPAISESRFVLELDPQLGERDLPVGMTFKTLVIPVDSKRTEIQANSALIPNLSVDFNPPENVKVSPNCLFFTIFVFFRVFSSFFVSFFFSFLLFCP